MIYTQQRIEKPSPKGLLLDSFAYEEVDSLIATSLYLKRRQLKVWYCRL